MTTNCIKVLKDFLEKERISLQIEVQGFDRHVDTKTALFTSFEELDGNSIDLIT
jgi:hypothetical protein